LLNLKTSIFVHIFGLRRLFQKRICLAFDADGGGWAVARDDRDLVRQVEKAGVDGFDDLRVVASGEVGAADASREESVAGEDHFERGEMQTDGTLSVSGGVDDLGGVVFEAYAAAVGQGFIGRSGFGCFDAEPGCLGGHHLEERKVCLIQVDWGAGKGLEFEGTADMVDVGVGDEDLLQSESERGEAAVDAGDFVAGVDDDGLAGFLVGKDGAIALQRADGKGFEDHEVILWELR
jgi:hypothetical protein